MESICYSWDDCPFSWMEAPFTWKEACVIQKIVEFGTSIPYKKRKKIQELSDDEKQTLIGLFFRLNVDEIIFEKKVNKNKNTKVKVSIKDVEVLMKEQKNIKIDINII